MDDNLSLSFLFDTKCTAKISQNTPQYQILSIMTSYDVMYIIDLKLKKCLAKSIVLLKQNVKETVSRVQNII